MERTQAVMFGGPRNLSSAPRDVPSLWPGDDTAVVRVTLSAQLLLQKSLFLFFSQKSLRTPCADPIFFDKPGLLVHAGAE